MVLYVCEDSTEGILCGVYDAWASRLGHDRVGLALAGAYNYEMFTEYRPVLTDRAKAQKVERAVRGKISERAWRWGPAACGAGRARKKAGDLRSPAFFIPRRLSSAKRICSRRVRAALRPGGGQGRAPAQGSPARVRCRQSPGF